MEDIGEERWRERARECGVAVMRAESGQYGDILQFTLSAIYGEGEAELVSFMGEGESWDYTTAICDAIDECSAFFCDVLQIDPRAVDGRILVRDEIENDCLDDLFHESDGCPLYFARTVEDGFIMRTSLPFGNKFEWEIETIRNFNIRRVRDKYENLIRSLKMTNHTLPTLEKCIGRPTREYNDMILDYALITGELPESAARLLNSANADRYRDFVVRRKLRAM